MPDDDMYMTSFNSVLTVSSYLASAGIFIFDRKDLKGIVAESPQGYNFLNISCCTMQFVKLHVCIY